MVPDVIWPIARKVVAARSIALSRSLGRLLNVGGWWMLLLPYIWLYYGLWTSVIVIVWNYESEFNMVLNNRNTNQLTLKTLELFCKWMPNNIRWQCSKMVKAFIEVGTYYRFLAQWSLQRTEGRETGSRAAGSRHVSRTRYHLVEHVDWSINNKTSSIGTITPNCELECVVNTTEDTRDGLRQKTT